MSFHLKPALLICDEPTTALDVTTQAEILKLVLMLQRESGTAVLFITHDLRVASQICDSIVVMRHGEVVEQGATRQVFTTPRHAYTAQLLASAPGRGFCFRSRSMSKSIPNYLDHMKRQADRIASVRQDIHHHPELGFQEFRTSDLVAQRLEEWGYEVGRGLGGTGVVGRLKRGDGTRSLGIRADMDALPIQEDTGLPYASCRDGVMHACGHDGHTAMLLGAAEYLAKHGDFSGTLNLIFQPAEESLGGAKRMIEEGLFEQYPCDAVFAMHNMPGVEQGRLLFREGAAMASSDYVTITLTGKGGHSAMPHLAVDPVVAAASIIMALQTIVSRNADPQETAVVTVAAVQAGKANNGIPNTVVLELSVRSLDRELRQLIRQRISNIVTAQADSFGVQAKIDYQQGYSVLVNTPAETEFARDIGRRLVGADNVDPQCKALTASEDFSFMLEKRPGCYLFIGNGERGLAGGCEVHNPGYDFNDRNLPIGSAYWAMLTEEYLR